MLTQFQIWSNLLSELKMSVLNKLIYLVDFPQSLVTFSNTSSFNVPFSQSKELWLEALRSLFPAIDTQYNAIIKNDPFTFFKTLYHQLIPLLKSNGLTFSDFVSAVLSKTPHLDPEKNIKLQALLFSAGHPLLKDEKPNPAINQQALIFAANLGNFSFIKMQLMLNKAQLDNPILAKALLEASKGNHHLIIDLLLSLPPQTYDATTLRTALVNAGTKGNIKIVMQFLNKPAVAFTLRKVVNLAIIHHYPDIISLLFRKFTLSRYYTEIRYAVPIAARNKSSSIIQHIYDLDPRSLDDSTIYNIFMISCAHGNINLIKKFINHSAIEKHPNLANFVNDCIKIALKQKDEEIASLLLEAYGSHLKSYTKRELLIEAEKKGFNLIIANLSPSSLSDMEIDSSESIDDSVSYLTNKLKQLSVEPIQAEMLNTHHLYTPSKPLSPKLAQQSVNKEYCNPSKTLTL